MKEREFKHWLLKGGNKDSTIRSRISNVKKIEEVYPDLDSRIDDTTISNLIKVFEYTIADKSRNRLPLHNIEIKGDIYEGTKTYKNALLLYVRFRTETDAQKTLSSSEEMLYLEKTDSDRGESEAVYKASEFRRWMVNEEKMSYSSAAGYLTYLKGVDNLLYNITGNNHYLTLVSQYMANNQSAAVIDLIIMTENFISGRMLSSTISQTEKKRLNDYRSALRKYKVFLEEDFEDIPDEEELCTDLDASGMLSEKGKCELWDYEDLESNFRFRLMTQNRISDKKDIFYPIGIIRKLFRYSQRYNSVNNDYDWFKNWVNTCVAQIIVATEKGDLTLKQLSELIIYPIEKKVKVKKTDDTYEYTVKTETGKTGTVPITMNIGCIRDIHIDHTPMMSKVLTDNSDFLPGLTLLSKYIKDVARKEKIAIQYSNLGKISKKLFANENFVEHMLLPLVPMLKRELEFLRGKYTLKLMQASNNLRKK